MASETRTMLDGLPLCARCGLLASDHVVSVTDCPEFTAAPPTPAQGREAERVVRVGPRHEVRTGLWSVPSMKGPRYSIADRETGREVFACAMVSQVVGWMGRHAEWYPTDNEVVALLALRARPLPADVQAAVERTRLTMAMSDADTPFAADLRLLLAHLTREAPDA